MTTTMTFATRLSKLSDAATQGEWKAAVDSYTVDRVWSDEGYDIACFEGDGSLPRTERKANEAMTILLVNRRREILALVEAVDAAYVDSSRTRALDRIFSARANLDRAQEG